MQSIVRMTAHEKKIASTMIGLLKKLKWDVTLRDAECLASTCPDYDFCNEQDNGMFYDDWAKNLESKFDFTPGKDNWMDLMSVHRIAVSSNTRRARPCRERDAA